MSRIVLHTITGGDTALNFSRMLALCQDFEQEMNVVSRITRFVYDLERKNRSRSKENPSSEQIQEWIQERVRSLKIYIALKDQANREAAAYRERDERPPREIFREKEIFEYQNPEIKNLFEKYDEFKVPTEVRSFVSTREMFPAEFPGDYLHLRIPIIYGKIPSCDCERTCTSSSHRASIDTSIFKLEIRCLNNVIEFITDNHIDCDCTSCINGLYDTEVVAVFHIYAKNIAKKFCSMYDYTLS